MTLSVLDSSGTPRNLSTTFDPSGNHVGSSAITDPTTGAKAAVAVLHQADNQQPGATANGVLTGGVAQVLNPAGNLDRQRGAGADLVPARGVITGSAQFAQEVLAGTTTTVTAGAATATLLMANTTNFQVGGVLNLEPGTVRYESAVITAVVANTSVAVQFPTGGALFTHTQPYLVQTFVYNQERDFSGEGPMAQGTGAAIATEFESNSGGPPLANGLASGWTIDTDRNIQGKNNQQLAVNSTTATATTLIFTANPWTNGLVVGQPIVLSVTANGAAIEEVIVSKNNTPATGAGPITINLVNPIVNSGSLFATFDAFGLGVPAAATPLGTEDTLIWLNNPNATDPKRPLAPLNAAPGAANTMSVSSDGSKATYRYAILAVTPVATPTDFIVIQGSATKTGRVKRVKLSGVATAQGNMPAQLVRRSSAGTLGSAVLTAVAAAKHDTGDAAATCVVSTVGTANYTTLGTSAGVEGVGRLGMPAAGTGATGQDLIWEFATRQDKALILRGTTDFLCVNLNGAAVPAGGVIDLEIEIEEDNS